MDVGGPYPFHAAAAAYQTGQVRRAEAASAAARVRTSLPVEPPAALTRVDSEVNRSPAFDGIQRLIAGRVSGGVDFDTTSMVPSHHGGSLQLYTRGADRMEAAMGVHRGRIVDLRG